MKRTALFLAMAFASSTALAFGCPKEMKAIDEALPKAKLSAAQMEEVKTLRAEGEKLHKEAKHKESMETLGKAKKTLGI